jgi:hypothetical protein
MCVWCAAAAGRCTQHSGLVTLATAWTVLTACCMSCFALLTLLFQVERLLPLCEYVHVIKRFVETRSQIQYPMVLQVSSSCCMRAGAGTAAAKSATETARHASICRLCYCSM